MKLKDLKEVLKVNEGVLDIAVRDDETTIQTSYGWSDIADVDEELLDLEVIEVRLYNQAISQREYGRQEAGIFIELKYEG